MRAMISQARLLAALALVASLGAAGGSANALTLAERSPAANDVTRVSITIPASRKSRLERGQHDFLYGQDVGAAEFGRAVGSE